MNGTLAVLRLELSERGRLFGVAAVLAIVPFVAAALPSMRAQRGEVLVTVSMFLAMIYSLALATAFGATAIAAPLAERRLTFYLTKPIGAVSLWVGKLIAAMGISAAVFAVVTIPARLAAPATSSAWGVSDSHLSAWTLAAMPVLFLVTHTLSTFIRSRSVRLAFDLAMLLATCSALLLIGRALFAGAAFRALGGLLVGVAIAFVAVLAVAPLYQLSRGRADVRRSHAALSNFLWITIAGVLGIAAAYAWWVTSAPLSSVQNFTAVAQSPDGRWVVAQGETNRGRYRAAWLVNTVTGEKQRLGGLMPWSGPAISRDGKTAVSIRPGFASSRTTVVLSPIEQGGRSRSIPIDGWPLDLALTPDASRIAIATSSSVAAYDTATGKLLTSASLRRRSVRAVGFVSRDMVRVMTSDPMRAQWSAHELDLVTRTWRPTGELAIAGRTVFSGDFSRVLVRPTLKRGEPQPREREAIVADVRTGATLFRVPAAAAATLLEDGRLAFVTTGANGAQMHITNIDGSEANVIPLPDGAGRFLGEAGEKLILSGDKGAMVVGVRDSSVRRFDSAHLASGEIDARLRQYDARGSVAGIDDQERLAVWSLTTGEKRRVE